MRHFLLAVAVVFACPCAWAVEATPLEKALAADVLPAAYGTISARAAYGRVARADAAADAAWLDVRDAGEMADLRRRLRRQMIEAIGGFPERTPMNAVAKASFRAEKYTVENVLFESSPGVLVSGNLYLPRDPRFPAPHPAVLVALGHSVKGKGARGYQHACVLLAKAGIAAFVCDPIEQGERFQPPGTGHNCSGHNAIGVRAAMLGLSMARIRMWDAIRAIDYLVSRPEVDADRIGMMGQSGGGTMTALVMAVDERIKAAAPSCYLSNFRSVCARMSPQDAEQNIFGQLAFGLNHLGLVLLRDIPIVLAGRHSDMFPYQGTLETYNMAVRALKGAGAGEGRLAMAFAPGPHGWTESTCAASVEWLRRWLFGDTAHAFTMSDHLHLDHGFSYDNSENGIAEPDSWCAPEGKVSNLAGFRSIYDLLSDKADLLARSRRRHSSAEKAALAIRRAVIRLPDKRPLRILAETAESHGDFKVEKIGFHTGEGYAFPGMLVTPASGVRAGAVPLLAVSQRGRAALAPRVAAALAQERPVLAVDVFGLGEIGKKEFNFYEVSKAYPEEAAAVSLYLLGESAVGWRAADLVGAADYCKKRFGLAADVFAEGTPAIAAAHAFAACRDLVASVEVAAPPASWHAAVHSPNLMYPFANVVNGALADYDWPDLLK